MTSYEIGDDFIGVFDNFFDEKLIDSYISHFKQAEDLGLTFNRQNGYGKANTDKHFIDDSSVSLLSNKATAEFNEEVSNVDFFRSTAGVNLIFLNTFFDKIYPIYAEKYSVLKNLGYHTIFDIKIQKTEPGQGFHSWHSENMVMKNSNRIHAWMLYLNDVNYGGETEFLYQKKRIQPKRNRFVIWPAYFTHYHRGNPPLKETKYVTTGWVEYGTQD